VPTTPNEIVPRLLILASLFGAAQFATIATAATADPDRQTKAVVIGEGASPGLAIDSVRRVVHLVYRAGPRLYHRTGDLSGRFGEPELVFTSASRGPALWDPRVVLDSAGTPHVVVADGHFQNDTLWYTHRRAGGWLAPLVVFEKSADRLDRATMPHFVLEPDGRTAVIGAFTVGGPAKGEGDEWGILARLEDLAATPRVVAKNRILPWNPQLALIDGRLWVGGRNIRTRDRQFSLQEFDRLTLTPLGEPLPLSDKRHGEIARMSADAWGEIHAAGTLNNAPTAETAGWYNTLSRARAGLPAINYLTTNRNASGAGHPIADRRTADRVYLVHWHGAIDAHHQPKAGTPGNFLHYVRLEAGKKVVEGRKISDRVAPHGDAYRHTPAVAAHPDGGIVVIFQETGPTDQLWYITVGAPAR
jgi:hypothetical protein